MGEFTVNDPPYQEMNSVPISTIDSPAVVLELIYQLKVKDVMNTALIAAKKDFTMRHAQALMKEKNISSLPVVENDLLLGMVSIEDIILAMDQGCIDIAVEKQMSRDVIILEDNMPLSFAISHLNKYNYSSFPVLNKKRELVGILTSKDVIRTLLIDMNREVLRLEKILQKDTRAPDKHAELDFNIVTRNFELAGRASTEIKKALKQREIDPRIIRRIAIACYELEINQVVHSLGGTIRCSIQPDKIVITASDTGPGIADIKQVLQEGWSTANEWIRSLGFGAGMGLPNTKRVSDEFSIESTIGTGTSVRSVVFINSLKEEDGS
jgi:CBS domain-containing protein/anti-sigma regulatory factor (Ser/Thr protein kinase)